MTQIDVETPTDSQSGLGAITFGDKSNRDQEDIEA